MECTKSLKVRRTASETAIARPTKFVRKWEVARVTAWQFNSIFFSIEYKKMALRISNEMIFGVIALIVVVVMVMNIAGVFNSSTPPTPTPTVIVVTNSVDKLKFSKPEVTSAPSKK